MWVCDALCGVEPVEVGSMWVVMQGEGNLGSMKHRSRRRKSKHHHHHDVPATEMLSLRHIVIDAEFSLKAAQGCKSTC